MTREELYSIAENTKVDLTGSDLLSGGYEIFKKNIGGFIGFLLINAMISGALSLIPIIGSMISMVMSVLLSAGQLIVIRKLRQGESVQFNDFFAAFSNAGPPLVLFIIQMLVIFASLIPCIIVVAIFFFQQIMNGEFSNSPDPAMLAFIFPILLLCLLPAMFLGVCYIFSMHIVLFINQDFWTAMEASRKYVMKNFWSVFGSLFVIGFLSTLLILVTCGLGYFVMLPTATAAVYLAFEKIFKPNANTLDSKIDTFGIEQKDINTEADERGI
jgi:hypothetical protein